jgi:predicted NAD/FAD-dependent oxidoreductase
MTSHYDVVIIGAGISGIMAARRLREAGKSVVVIDKGVSPGGRLATRRIGPGKADHGAQFFTVRSAEFQSLVEDWLRYGWVFEWSRGWASGSLASGPTDGYARYAAVDGFNRLAKHLATDLDIRLSAKIIALTAGQSGIWLATGANGLAFQSDTLILTAPIPQSLDLLQAGQFNLDDTDRAILQSVNYAPCLCGLFLVEGDVLLPEPGALQRPDQPISWIADNQRKSISPGGKVITVHAGPIASRLRWAEAEESILSWMKGELATVFDPSTRVLAAQLKRWRFALPEVTLPERFLLAQTLKPLYFAGDAFGGPRIEGAVLSGLATAQAVLGSDNAQYSYF